MHISENILIFYALINLVNCMVYVFYLNKAVKKEEISESVI